MPARDKRRSGALQDAIVTYLFARLSWPRSRDIHSAICADWPIALAPTLAEVRAAMQRLKAAGRVRTGGHYAWQLTDSTRSALKREEREARERFDARGR